MRTTKDKQNRGYLRNSRDAAALRSQSELSEVQGVKLKGALRRTNNAASLARFKSDTINYHLSKTLVNALLQVNASKLTRAENAIVKTFNELMHMDLKQARMSRHCPTKEDVIVLFKILKKANPRKANALAQTFKFRKILY